MKYFSASTMRFYDDSINTFMPEDIVQISDDVHAGIFLAQSQGLVIVAGKNGMPTVSSPPLPTPEQLAIQAEQQKIQQRREADLEITWRQDAVDADIATNEEKIALAAWKKYRVLLMRVDTAAPVWPTAPVKEAS